jgi:RHS repeat-associated protein
MNLPKALREKQLSNSDYYSFGMLMPDRSFSTGYRFGFNGKESDNEISGNGNQYDYGFRIYNPRIAKFLSVDPLTKEYPELTPYQFASNSPISGIDLDGLEYLYAHEARIEAVSGQVKLKVQNMHWVTQNLIKAYSENPKNWQSGEVGVSAEIALTNVNTNKQNENWGIGTPSMQDSPNDPSTNSPSSIRTESPRGKPQPQSVSTNNQILSTKVSNRFLILDQVGKGLNLIAGWLVKDDANKVSEHGTLYVSALKDVNTAIKNGWIDNKHMNIKDLSAIVNVVLQGDNTSKDKYNYNVGMKIVKEISNNYKGTDASTSTGAPMPPNSDAKEKTD